MSLDIGLSVIVDGHAVSVMDGENYTHNVVPMWDRAGCYEALYESDGRKAVEVTASLQEAVRRMEAEPDEYRKLNPPNGWGEYSSALAFLKRVTAAFEKFPSATIWVSA